METGKYKDQIAKIAQDAGAKGARGTPSLVIGQSTRNGVIGQMWLGAMAYGRIDQLLRDFQQKNQAPSR